MNRALILKLFIWIYCLSWAFDFRGEDDGGNIVQYLFFAVTLGAAGVVICLGWRRLFILPSGWLIIWWGAYLLSTFLVAKVNGVEMGWYLRNLIPPLLLMLSMCVTQIAAGEGYSYKTILYPMLIAGVTNVLWRAVYILIVRGTSLDMVRVEMLSQCLPMLLAFMFCGLALRTKWPLVPLAIGMIGITSYVVSITRSAIFILLAEGLACAWCVWVARRMRVLPRGFRDRKLRHLFTGTGIVFVIIALAVICAPFVFERWAERLFNPVGGAQSSADPSALTRLAETKAFVTLLNEEPASWIYGRGLGYPYYWDDAYIPELAQYTYGNEDLFRSFCAQVQFPGHSIWTYATFSGGVLGLIFYLGLFVISTYWALKATKQLRFLTEFPLDVAFLPFVGLVGFLSLSLTFNPFIERASAITIGMLMTFPTFLIVAAWRKQTVTPLILNTAIGK
jgi:hypothetical protein